MGTVAERVTDLRSRAKLTRKELARLAGLSVSLIGHVERGLRKSPSAGTLNALAGVFGCGFEYLFSGTEPGPSDRTLRKAVAEARAAKQEAA